MVIASSSDQQNRLPLAGALPSPDTCCVYYTLQRRYRQQAGGKGRLLEHSS